MSDFLKKALANAGLAMEDAEVVTDVEVEDTPIEEVIEESDAEEDPVEEGVEEAEEAAEELEEGTDSVETSEEVVEALESIYASMESAVADGGMTAREAGFAQAAISAQLKRLHVSAPAQFSSESFVSLEDRQANTKLAMEGVKELGKKIVEAIRAALKSLREAVKNFWIKITDTAGRLAKRAQELIKVVADKKGDPKVDLLYGGAIKIAQWLSAGAKTQDWPKQAAAVSKATYAVLGFAKNVRTGLSQLAEGKEMRMPELDTSVFTNLPQGAKLVKAGVDSFGYKLEVEKSREGANDKYDMLKKEQMKTILGIVAEVATQLSVYRKEWAQTEAALDGALKKMEAKADSSAYEVNDMQKSIQSKFTKAARSALSLPQTWSSYALRVLNGYVSIAALCVKHWDAEPTKVFK